MTDSKNFLYLSEQTLDGLDISTADSIAAIEAAIRGRARSTVWNAPKAVLQPPDGRYMMATLAAADDPPLMAVKSLILNPRNPERGLPQINALITLLDSETGLPAAVMDGNWITAVRTAGLSAVAAKRMARPESAVAGFVGSGVQACSHLRAFVSMFPLSHIKVFGRGRPNIDALCAVAADLGLTSEVCESGRNAVEEADLIVTSVTFSADFDPFLDARWLRQGSFATVTDFAAPWHKDSFAAFDRIVIDDLEQEKAMPVKLVEPDLVLGDLSTLVMGEIEGRGNEEERTAFIFRAHPLGDFALAALAYRKAKDLSRGVEIER